MRREEVEEYTASGIQALCGPFASFYIRIHNSDGSVFHIKAQEARAVVNLEKRI